MSAMNRSYDMFAEDSFGPVSQKHLRHDNEYGDIDLSGGGQDPPGFVGETPNNTTNADADNDGACAVGGFFSAVQNKRFVSVNAIADINVRDTQCDCDCELTGEYEYCVNRDVRCANGERNVVERMSHAENEREIEMGGVGGRSPPTAERNEAPRTTLRCVRDVK